MSFNEVLFCAGIICSFTVLISSMYRLRKQNVKLNIKLSKLAKETGHELDAMYKISDEDEIKLRMLKSQNRKMDAIKVLKSNYKMPLVEAKAYIDFL